MAAALNSLTMSGMLRMFPEEASGSSPSAANVATRATQSTIVGREVKETDFNPQYYGVWRLKSFEKVFVFLMKITEKNIGTLKKLIRHKRFLAPWVLPERGWANIAPIPGRLLTASMPGKPKIASIGLAIYLDL